ncbi:hypothetical protein K493DRAFT_320412 [Basidiobolus meristosporus CBS 931.73]|uniref:Uncharacterized protein n=1 Tax=Basidiobolus meristosporus CBS 931.73 TaxID=1314790 RepID=A0A1Y1XAA4_9FUNG|nr:hypothetical protein K493DRAFT_320412 [Basidiobolus meristosporus CBS 931.73]|eukprot:ORX82668.1 hypothetical protein K493DRAFT_320412 [Basidiobolus meristosporus CBS 931.73]
MKFILALVATALSLGVVSAMPAAPCVTLCERTYRSCIVGCQAQDRLCSQKCYSAELKCRSGCPR